MLFQVLATLAPSLQEWTLALSEDFLFNLPVDINWEFFDGRFLSRCVHVVWKNPPACGTGSFVDLGCQADVAVLGMKAGVVGLIIAHVCSQFFQCCDGVLSLLAIVQSCTGSSSDGFPRTDRTAVGVTCNIM